MRQIANILTFLFTLALNGAANALPINGRNTGEISDMYPVLFTPAGYVFSIWGLIYLLLAGFTIYQALPAQRNDVRLERVGYWLSAANLLNGVWILAWHYDFLPLSLLIMLALLGALIMIYLKLDINRPHVRPLERLLVDTPFSVYLGWISVATVANAAIVLYDLGWRGQPLSEPVWAALMIAVAAMLGALMLARRSDMAYVLVLVWAFGGIAIKQSAAPLAAGAAVAAAAALAVMLALSVARRRVVG